MSIGLVGSLDDIQSQIKTLEGKVGQLEGRRLALSGQLEEVRRRLSEINEEQETYVKAVEVLTLAQTVVREGVRNSFEEVITYGLQHILGSDYSFEMEFTRRGNLQEVSFNVKSRTLAGGYDPLDTSGGGVIDIVSLALRVAIIELHQPRIDGPIVLDESFKHLSRQHLYSAGGFLKALTERINRQIIMVSHKSEFEKEADKAITVK